MNEWYEEGLCFECQQSGNCCTGPPGSVWFDDGEGRAMAKQCGGTVEDFYAQFARKLGNRWSLKEHVVDGKHDCVFLDRTSDRSSCKLYNARPLQCRTWPFWKENLRTPDAWKRAKEETP
ncbi:MAG: YkgJ family cysteine cluster protein, partial [Phycisphaerales bacterium]|nr:YkgJ family cysteine cluster protein [Phycisphaerales bacterium]